MARLVTSHDPYHIHKALGVFVLLNFARRLWRIFTVGTAFPPTESVESATLSVLIHGALSWSSLLLPLPQKRNFNSPMIWPEARWHSIIFATRHVVATLLSLNDLWPRGILPNALTKLALTLGTVRAASFVTDQLGCREKRSTNALPYPDYVTDEQQKEIKQRYSNCQFGATQLAMIPDPTLNFIALYGIQASPLLMTLVRKGKIGSARYHQLYAFSLWICGLFSMVRLWETDSSSCWHIVFSGIVGSYVVRKLRIQKRWNTYFLWSLHVALVWVLYPMFLRQLMARLDFVDTKWLALLTLEPIIIHGLKYSVLF